MTPDAKRAPLGKALVPNTIDTTSTTAHPTTACPELDPRRAVTTVSLRTLIAAYIGDTVWPFDMLDDPDTGEIRFVCPSCGTRDHNGGTAVTRGNWRFDCHRCRRTFTRMLLERIVLEHDDCMNTLSRLIADGER